MSQQPPWNWNGVIDAEKLFNGILAEEVQKKDITSPVDLLAWSAHAYRLHSDNPSLRYELFNRIQCDMVADVNSQLTDQDRETADKICHYFQKKIVWKTLAGRGNGISEQQYPGVRNNMSFSQRVMEFLSGNRRYCSRDSIGMVYRLPEFYDFDQRILVAREQQSWDTCDPSIESEYSEHVELTVTPVLFQTRNIRGSSEHWYLVNTEQFKIPAVLRVSNYGLNSGVLGVWNQLFNLVDKIPITGVFTRRSYFGDFDYLSSSRWTISQDFFSRAIDERFRRS